jgi:nicotinamidase-related amidase
MSDLRTRQLGALGPRPALVVVDMQRSFADPALIAPYAPSPGALDAVAAAVTATADLVRAARDSGVPVVWVELGSDPARRWRASQWLRTGDPDAPYGPDEPCVLGTSTNINAKMPVGTLPQVIRQLKVKCTNCRVSAR